MSANEAVDNSETTARSTARRRLRGNLARSAKPQVRGQNDCEETPHCEETSRAVQNRRSEGYSHPLINPSPYGGEDEHVPRLTPRGVRNIYAHTLDRLLPSRALAWGRLTRESDDWHDKARRWCIANIDATPTRPCPAYTRLDNLMAGDGKIEADAWVPQQLDGWWRG